MREQCDHAVSCCLFPFLIHDDICGKIFIDGNRVESLMFRKESFNLILILVFIKCTCTVNKGAAGTDHFRRMLKDRILQRNKLIEFIIREFLPDVGLPPEKSQAAAGNITKDNVICLFGILVIFIDLRSIGTQSLNGRKAQSLTVIPDQLKPCLIDINSKDAQVVSAHLGHVSGFTARCRTAVEDLVRNSRMCDVRSKHGALALNEHAVFIEALSILQAVKTACYLYTVRDKGSLDSSDAFFLEFFYERLTVSLVRIEPYGNMCRFE